MINKTITFLGQTAIVACDEKCEKAWGINKRKKKYLSTTNKDKWEFYSDDELKIAPIDPKSYEGGYGKPINKDDRLNRWCVRQCERHFFGKPGDKIILPDFSKRELNIPKNI